jgi:hypothetical protein
MERFQQLILATRAGRFYSVPEFRNEVVKDGGLDTSNKSNGCGSGNAFPEQAS